MAGIERVYSRVSQRTKDCLKGHPQDEVGATNCWFCRVNISMKDKFIAVKTNDPIDRRILHLQQNLGLRPGEPLSFANINRLIPPMVSRYSRNLHNQAKPGKPFPSLQGRSKENDLHRGVQRLVVPAAPKDFNKESKPTCFSGSYTLNSASTESQKNYVITSEKRNNALHQRHFSNPYPANKGSQQTANVAFKGSNVAHQRHSTNPQATIKRSNKCSTVIGDIPKFTIPEKSTSSETTKERSESPATLPEKRSTIPDPKHSASCRFTKILTEQPNIVHDKPTSRPKLSESISKNINEVLIPELLLNPHVIQKVPESNIIPKDNIEKSATGPRKISIISHQTHSFNNSLSKKKPHHIASVPVMSKIVHQKQSSDTQFAKTIYDEHSSISCNLITFPLSKESTTYENAKVIPISPITTPVKYSNVPSSDHFKTSGITNGKPRNSANSSAEHNTVLNSTTDEKSEIISNDRHSSTHHITKRAEQTANVPVSHQNELSNIQSTKSRSEKCTNLCDNIKMVSLLKQSTNCESKEKSSPTLFNLPSQNTKKLNPKHSSTSNITKNGMKVIKSDNNKCATISKFSVNISIELSKVSLPQLNSNPHVVKMRPKSPSTVLLKDSKVPNLKSSSNNKLANTVLEKTTTANENHIKLTHKRHHSDHLLKKETKKIVTAPKKCSKVVRRHSSDSSSAKEKLEQGASVSGKCLTVSPSESTKSELTKKIPATSAIFTANPSKVPNLEHFSTSKPLKIGSAQCRINHDKYENIRKFSSKDLAGISVPELFSNPHLIKRVPKLTPTVPNGRSTILPNSRTSSHQYTKTGHTFLDTVPHPGLCRSSKPLSVQPFESAPSKGVKRHLSNAEVPATKKILCNKKAS